MHKVMTWRFHALMSWCLIVILNLFAQQAYAIAPGGNNTQTVRFGAIATETMGNAPFAVSATASSALEITSYSSSTPSICTISGSTVTLVSAGSCTLNAYQAGNSNWQPASGSVTFSVVLKAQTITFGALGNKTYLNPNFTVSATSTSGGGVSFAASPASVCSMANATTVSIAGAGTCTVTASQGGGGIYAAATPVANAFTVLPAAQTITFTQLAARTFSANTTFAAPATSSSGLTVNLTSATATICTVSGTTVTMKAGGLCTIDANVPATTDYTAAPQVVNSFMLNIAPVISVTGPGDGNAYTPNSALTFTAGETPGTYTVSNVTYYDTATGTALCSATATPWSCTDSAGLATGSYAIYAVINTTSSLSVTSLPITVTVGTGTGGPVSSATPIPVAITAPSISNPVAGAIPGALSATVNGSAAYAMPLALPPGAGITPSLTLNYDSQQGNGFLGLGWSLGGMSSMHRCGKTIAQDNVTTGVNFTTTDRLCLDGQRLVLLTAGTGATGNPDVDYWTVGATYSTEVANFSRITSYAGAKGLAFKVETKPGRILYYGDQGDGTSYITAQGNSNVAIVWALGQVQDLSGNYYTISYSDNTTTTGEYLPAQIQYGGNNQTGLAAHLSVVFNYSTTRTDNTVRYIAGSHNDMVSLISTIKAYNGLFSSGTATEVREYDISYVTSPSSGRTLLNSVQMKALNPQTNILTPFPATTFSWNQSGTPTFTESGTTAVAGPVAPFGGTTPAIEFNNIIWADFNGDGMTDAMVVDTSKTPVQYNIYLAKAGGGFAAPIVWTVPTAIASTIASRQTAEAATGYPFHYAAVGTTASNNPGLSGWGLVGDFNGDGSSDLYLFGGFVCLSQLKTNPTAVNAFNCNDSLTNTAATSGMGASLVSWNAEDYLVMNTTGSGLSDILVRNGQFSDGTRCVSSMTNGVQAFTCGVYTGTNQTISGAAGPSTAPPLFSNAVGTFAGSGHQDVYRKNTTSTATMEVCASGSTGFTCSSWGLFPATTSNGLAGSSYLDSTPPVFGGSTTADANGDGLTDVLISGIEPTTGNGTDAMICYSTGTKFDCHTLTAASGADSVMQFIGAVDSDGSIKTLAYEYNAAGTGGAWRTCTIQNNSTLNCKTIAGGPTMPAINGTTAPDPLLMLGSYLNDGSLNLLAYNEAIDDTSTTNGAKTNNFTSVGAAWTPYTLAQGAAMAADQLASVTNGVGRTDTVTYTQGGQPSVYSQYATVNGAAVYPTYPSASVPNPGYVVSTINIANGQDGFALTNYTYTGLAVDVTGRGSLGFASLNGYNVQSNIDTITNYHQDWPYVGMVKSAVTTYNVGGTNTLNTTTNDVATIALPNTYYSGNSQVGGSETTICNTCFAYYLDSTVVRADLNGNDLGTTVTNNVTYDNFGNLLTSTATSKLATDSSAFVTTTSNTFDNNSGTCVATHGTTYVIGRVCGSSVTKTNEAGTTITRANAHTYFATGLSQTDTIEPGHTTLPADNLQVTNTYTRDGYGNVLTTVQNWIDSASGAAMSRTMSATYNTDGRFMAGATNAIGQTESYVTDPVTGVRTQLTDINGLVTSWTVDGTGRVLSQTTPDGTLTQTYVNLCVSDCPSGATTVTITTKTNGGNQITVPVLAYANPLGQVLRTMSYGFTGTPIITDQTFDTRGRKLAGYQPVFASGATATYPSGTLASSQTLDDLNRQLTAVTLDTSGATLTTTTTYAGKTKTMVNPVGETRTETRDAIGELIGVQTAAYNNAPQTNTAFAYDPFGNLVQTTDPAGNNINVTFDVMGHKTQLNDPDLGIINYSVDPVGRTWKQVSPNENAASTATTFQFDMADRMIARIEPDLNSYFIYDVSAATGAVLTAAQISSCQSAHSCGKLVESYTAPLSSGNVGLINSTNSAKETDTVYNYDNLGRPANSTLTLDASINMTFYSETDYDAWSRPITQITQHGTDPQKIFDQRYNGYGYLQSVQRGGLTLWQATSQDAMNRVVTAHIATAGGGGDGLIVTRCYDANTGRVDSTVVASPANTVACGTTPAIATFDESYTYDPLGNVQQRSEAWNQGVTGTVASQSFSEGFTYDGLNRIYTSTVANQAQQSYTYTVDGNILTNTIAGSYVYTGGTSGGPHAVKTVSGAATAFTYDADGNQLTGNSHINTWSSFDMALTMSYSGEGAQFPTNSSQFTYGPNHERRTQTQGSSAIIYYGGAQEVQTDISHNVQQIKTYWPMGLGVEIDAPGQTATVLNWTHTDHLGSTVAITDIDGNLKEALGYDTWGNRRNPEGAPVSIATTLTAAINENTDDKGFTGAEQITSLGLVHLNGRVYDPLIGKFLSGDPLVASPTNGQNYNRYAYVLNNPMNATDPTGFKALTLQWWNELAGYSGGNYDGEQGFDSRGTSTTTVTTTSIDTITFSDGSSISMTTVTTTTTVMGTTGTMVAPSSGSSFAISFTDSAGDGNTGSVADGGAAASGGAVATNTTAGVVSGYAANAGSLTGAAIGTTGIPIGGTPYGLSPMSQDSAAPPGFTIGSVTFEGSEETQTALITAWNKVGSTPIGSQLENGAMSASAPITITALSQYPSNAFWDPNTRTISIDPNFNPPTLVGTESTPTYENASTDVILAHELGHAVTGALDNGPNQMNNVNQNENPYRQQQGLPPRLAY